MNLKVTLFLLCLAALKPTHADIIVLVHGYLGDGKSWSTAGISSELTYRGWSNGGVLTPGTRAFADEPKPRPANDTFYAVNLPSTAPLIMQSDLLWALLNKIFDRHTGETVILVGHSAGGVVARLALVRFGPDQVSTLITLAAPHLGTPRALDGLEIIQDQGPFEIVKNLVGGQDYRKVKNSGPALWDLSPPRPGNLLYWLNGQEHPQIRYVSVLRVPDGERSDEWVPVFSQDINQIPPLRGQSEVVATPGDHFLRRADGALIDRLVRATGRG